LNDKSASFKCDGRLCRQIVLFNSVHNLLTTRPVILPILPDKGEVLLDCYLVGVISCGTIWLMNFKQTARIVTIVVAGIVNENH